MYYCTFGYFRIVWRYFELMGFVLFVPYCIWNSFARTTQGSNLGSATPRRAAVQCFPSPQPCSGISGDPSALFTAYPPPDKQPAIPSLSTGEFAQPPYHYSVNPPFSPLPSNCHARLPANQYCYHLPSQSSGVQRPVHFAAPHFVYVYLFFQTTIRRYFIPFPRMLSSTEWSCQCDSTRDGSNFSFSSSLTHSCFEFEFCNSGPT